MRTAGKWQKWMTRTAAAVLLAGVGLLGASSASALTISWMAGSGGSLGSGSISDAMLGCDVSQPFVCGDPNNPNMQMWTDGTADYGFVLNGVAGEPDPVVTLGFGFTNNTLVDQDFTISTVLPIVPPQLAPITVASSMGMTVTEGTPPGTATVSTFGGNPFFVGTIDGSEVPVSALFADPSSFGCVAGSILPCTDTISDSSGVIVLPGDSALVSIGMIFRFNLSPGDTVSGTGTFVVEEQVVPEPAAGALLLAGLVGLVAWERRRA